MERHFPGGARAATKSVFNVGEDIRNLVRAGESVAPVAQRVGPNFQRVVDAERVRGVDITTGQPSSVYTVVTNAAGEVVTMFPGLPMR